MINKSAYKIKGRLGELLIEAGIITREQLLEALEKQKQIGGKLGEVLIVMGVITEDVLLNFLGKQCGVPAVDLSKYIDIDEKVVNSLPIGIVRRYLVMPIEKRNNILTLATSDPLNIFVIDDIKVMTGLEIKMVIASEQKIKEAINNYYSVKDSIDDIVKTLPGEKNSSLEIIDQSKEEEDEGHLSDQANEAPVIKLVNFVITSAINKGASDLHIEPLDKRVRIRYRIDGMLYEQPAPPKRFYGAFVSRIKIMSNLNIAEKRLPQDGRIKIKLLDREVDLRVSTIPTGFGEKVVLRILNSGSLCVNLNSLGFDEASLKKFRKNIEVPYGMVLITGPTGSGKTTTLYSALSFLNYPDRNIMTIEDPIEYNLPGITQVQTKNEIGLDFAAGLRSFLRQDPDIIMVGEIRDKETAEIAISAALTGHFVLSTLHTNDAPGAITRLQNMGIEPFLIVSSLLMIVAQRLVRVICPKCKESYTVSIQDLERMGINCQVKSNNVTLYRGKGCDYCNGTGYKGRIGCYEVLDVDNEIKNLIIQGTSDSNIKELVRRKGMMTIREEGIQKLLQGITTVEEILRVTMTDKDQEE